MSRAQEWSYPSGVFIYWDGPTAVIHERDCSHKDTQFENMDSVRSLLVSSRGIARAVVEHWGKMSIGASIADQVRSSNKGVLATECWPALLTDVY